MYRGDGYPDFLVRLKWLVYIDLFHATHYKKKVQTYRISTRSVAATARPKGGKRTWD